MNYIQLTLKNGVKVRAYISRYDHGNAVYIQLVVDGDQDDMVDGEPWATASVNPLLELPEGYVAIKNWSENEGIERDLLDAGIVEGQPVKHIPSGFVTIPVYKLTQKALSVLHI